MKEEIYRLLSGDDKQKRAAVMSTIEEMIHNGSMDRIECLKVADLLIHALKNEKSQTAHLQLLGFGKTITDELRGFEGNCYSSIFLSIFYSKIPEMSKYFDAHSSVVMLGNIFKNRFVNRIDNSELVGKIEDTLLFSAENTIGDIKYSSIEFLRYSNNPNVWKALGKMIDANPKSTEASLAKESLRIAGERTEISTGVFAKPAPWFKPLEMMNKMRLRKQFRPALASL